MMMAGQGFIDLGLAERALTVYYLTDMTRILLLMYYLIHQEQSCVKRPNNNTYRVKHWFVFIRCNNTQQSDSYLQFTLKNSSLNLSEKQHV